MNTCPSSCIHQGLNLVDFSWRCYEDGLAAALNVGEELKQELPGYPYLRHDHCWIESDLKTLPLFSNPAPLASKGGENA